MLAAFLLVIAICIDAFTTSITYGIGGIKIPTISALIISFMGTVFLTVSLFFAKVISGYISPQLCITLSVSLLILIGVTNLFQNTIKAYLRKNKKKNVRFSLFNISFVIDIFLDETKADIDNSKTLSAMEALMLGFALSVDSLATGFCAGLSVVSIPEAIALCFLIGFLAVSLGCFIGEKVSKRTKVDLSWLSGVTLIILAVSKLFIVN